MVTPKTWMGEGGGGAKKGVGSVGGGAKKVIGEEGGRTHAPLELDQIGLGAIG